MPARRLVTSMPTELPIPKGCEGFAPSTAEMVWLRFQLWRARRMWDRSDRLKLRADRILRRAEDAIARADAAAERRENGRRP